MNSIKINGVLSAGGKKYKQGHLYNLEVARKSGTVDTVIVLGEEGLQEGPVHIEGALKADYIHTLGVVTYIVPEKVEEGEADGYSRGEVTGILKSEPVCRKTNGGKSIASLLLKTDDGVVPVILWGVNAEKSDMYRRGDELTATGRMQSRPYTNKKGERHTAYELSASRIDFAERDE